MNLSKQQLVAAVGAFLLLLGVFLPVIKLPFVGNISLLDHGSTQGIILLGFSLAALLSVFLNKIPVVRWIGAVCTLMIAYNLYMAYTRLNEAKQDLIGDIQDNPFDGVAHTLMDSVQLQYGWAVLLIGSILLFVATFMYTEVEERRLVNSVSSDTDAQTNSANQTHAANQTHIVAQANAAHQSNTATQYDRPSNIQTKSSDALPVSNPVAEDDPEIEPLSRLVAEDAFAYNQAYASAADQDVDLKSCPACQQSLRITAIRCKHCGIVLES